MFKLILFYLLKNIQREKARWRQIKYIMDCTLTDFSRFLEYFILNGPDPKALDSVLAQLNDTKRKQPQDLDKAVIGM